MKFAYLFAALLVLGCGNDDGMKISYDTSALPESWMQSSVSDAGAFWNDYYGTEIFSDGPPYTHSVLWLPVYDNAIANPSGYPQGTVIFDSDGATWVACDRPGQPGRNFPKTAKHELGHVIGLGHGDEPQSIMRVGVACP